MHELKVRGGTKSIYNDSLVYKGDFSESQRILLKLNCDQVHASTVVRTEEIGLELSAGMFAGGACVAFAIVLAILAFVLWRWVVNFGRAIVLLVECTQIRHSVFRKYFNESYYYLDESPATPAPSIVPDWDIEQPMAQNSGHEQKKKTAIPAHMFISHVGGLHSDGDIGFSKEYEAIQAMSTQEEFPADSSYLADNKLKNRYHNVVACK